MLGKFIGVYKECMTTESGDFVLSFTAESGERYSAKQLAAAARTVRENGKERLKIEVSLYKEQRSLNANAYFHVLVDKIAKVMELGADEVKRKMVLEYGTPATEGGDTIFAALPKSAQAEKYYPYPKWIGDFTAKNGKPYSQYLLLKQTHTLDKSEMARLIDGVVYEAQELGIETKTPEEIELMKQRWDGCREA